MAPTTDAPRRTPFGRGSGARGCVVGGGGNRRDEADGSGGEGTNGPF